VVDVPKATAEILASRVIHDFAVLPCSR
jgi:hypothetical protein